MNWLKEQKINRGKFLTISAVTASGLMMGINGCLSKEGEKTSDNKTLTKIDKLAGMPLEELLKQYRYYLFDDYLPFLDKYVIDHKYGGFMCNTDRDGKNITTNKTAWYEGRGIWVYSFLYNNIKKDPKYLEVARKSVEFILKNEPKGDSFWPSSFSREGEPISDPPDSFYGDLFIANGLSEYSKATGEEKYWNKAKEILLKCMKRYDNPDYGYIVTYGPGGSYDITKMARNDTKTPTDINHPKGARVLGHWMVLIRLVSQMLEHKSDPDLEEIADRSIDAIMNHHFNSEYDLISEVMNHDLSRPEGAFSQFVYTGHAIETLWMLLYEAMRRNDKKLFNLSSERFQRHVEVAKDDVYGGVFRALINVDENIWKVDKVLWAQEEVLIGSLYVLRHTRARWAKEMFEKQWAYVIDKYPLKQYGYPLWILSADRKVTFEKHYSRVGNFHHPRHLMLNILNLEAMIKNT